MLSSLNFQAFNSIFVNIILRTPGFYYITEDKIQRLTSASYTKRSFHRRRTVLHAKAEAKFAEPFPCLKCQRLGVARHDNLIRDLADWNSHVAKSHNSAIAPHQPCAVTTRCLFCNTTVFNKTSHVSTYWKRGEFDAPFPSEECTREGAGSYLRREPRCRTTPRDQGQ